MTLLIIISLVVILISLMLLKLNLFHIKQIAIGVILIIVSLWFCYAFNLEGSLKALKIIIIWTWLCSFYNYSIYHGTKFFKEAEIKNILSKTLICYAGPIFYCGLISGFVWFAIKNSEFENLKVTFVEVFVPTLISTVLGTYKGIYNVEKSHNGN